jgi:hypothetical protein
MVEVEHIIADSGNVDGFDSWKNQGTDLGIEPALGPPAFNS